MSVLCMVIALYYLVTVVDSCSFPCDFFYSNEDIASIIELQYTYSKMVAITVSIRVAAAGQCSGVLLLIDLLAVLREKGNTLPLKRLG